MPHCICYSRYLKLQKNNCPLCSEGNSCGFKFPEKRDFQIGGKFAYVLFPLSESKFPKDLFAFVHPVGWSENYDHEPFHSIYNIIQILNKIKYYDCC